MSTTTIANIQHTDKERESERVSGKRNARERKEKFTFAKSINNLKEKRNFLREKQKKQTD